MIKHSTVIKRIIKDSWRFVVGAILYIGSITLLSKGAELYLGWDAENTYYALFLSTMVLWFFWEAYKYKKWQINFEQEKMMRELGKKND